MASRTLSQPLSDQPDVSRGREIAGILAAAAGLFVGLSLISVQFGSGKLTGPAGEQVGIAVYAALGIAGYLVVWAFGAVALRLWGGRGVGLWRLENAGYLGLMVATAILLHILFGTHRLAGYSPGGVVGEYAGEFLSTFVSSVGTGLLAVAWMALSLVLCTAVKIATVLRYVKRGTTVGAKLAAALVWEGMLRLYDSWPFWPRRWDAAPEAAEAAPTAAMVPTSEAAVSQPLVEGDSGGVVLMPADEGDTIRTDSGATAAPPAETVAAPDAIEPIIHETQFRKKRAEELGAEKQEPRPDFIKHGDGVFVPPGAELLDYEESDDAELDRSAMKELAARLEQALTDYGVRGRVTEIHPGPVVTMYEFVPEAGTRVAKISGLADDLAMRLEAVSVRIVAPIPGKAAVGIEVPNRSREIVYLKEIVTDDAFTKHRSKLTLALGKEIAGRPVAEDLAKMPHLLVAGTTGSGKSVSMHGMICSLLMNATPEEARLILVDPKMLELSVYEGIPHLLLPVVTDPKKANLALRWAVDEMDRRYELLSSAGVRDIVAYNRKVERLLAGEDVTGKGAKRRKGGKKKRIQVVLTSADGQEQLVDAEAEDVSGPIEVDPPPPAPLPRKLPYIVIVIDEFSDLMMCASKEVEASVARIAQKARAAGIHLILATQRPSVDVITGTIKANFPSRMALRVVSKVDSKVILDQQGAEALLGQGDMLFTKVGAAPTRVHGAYVSDTEVARIVEYLKEQGSPVYDLEILRPRAEEDADGEGEDEPVDDLYDQAVAIVAETRKASISMIQRRLRVGYNRAARMVERMEREGVVGPQDHLKEREVLVSAMAS